MKKVKLVTKCRGCEDVDVTVYENGVPGLFVGRLLTQKDQGGNWAIYHHSGLPLPGDGWTTRKKANDVMQELVVFTDWTQTQEEIAKNPHLGQGVRKVYARHRT